MRRLSDAGQEPLADRETGLEALGLPDFLRDPLGLLRRRWRGMIVVAGLGIGATLGYVTTLEPRYLAKASVLVTSQQISEDFVRPTVEANEFEKINAIVGNVLSRSTLGRIIEEHGLYPPPKGEKWSMEERVAHMREDIEIGTDQGVGQRGRAEAARIYAIQFRADSPKLAADVANELARRFTDAHLRMRTQQAKLTTEFLTRELERTERELREQERRITEFKQAHRGELPSELNTNLARLERLQQQRQSLAIQIAEAQSRVAGLMESNTDPDSPEARLSTLRARLEQERAIWTDEHPNVTSLQRQVEAVEQEIAAKGGASEEPSRPALVAAAQRTVAELRSQLTSTEATLEELDGRVARTPARQEELEALVQREAILRESYLEFQRKVKQAELAEAVESAQQGERVTVLDPAVPPRFPEKEGRKFLVLGILASLGVAGALGILLEMLDSVLVRADQIEAEFDVPVLGSISKIS